MWRPVLAGVVASLAVAGPAAARPAHDLSVSKLTGVPGRALTGHAVRLGVRVLNAGSKASGRAKVSVRLVPLGTKRAVRAIGSARVPALKPGHGATIHIRAAVRGDSPRTPSAFRVCVPPGTGRNDCATSKAVKIASGGSFDLIGAALRAHRLKLGRAYLYALYALRGDPRLPRAYRGKGPAAGGALISSLVADLPKLSAADRRALKPFFLPPTFAKSAWAGKRARKASAAADAPACSDPSKLRGVWTVLETRHVSIWYHVHSASGKANARRIGAAIEGAIWPKLTGAFEAPLPDLNAPCQGGLNGKPDIFLEAASDPAFKIDDSNSALGVTMQLDVTSPFGSGGCRGYPAWILLQESATRSTVAHEFMHAVQFSYQTCPENRYAEWVEGTGVWAEYFVYPGDQNRALPSFSGQLRVPTAPTRVPASPGQRDFGLYLRAYDWWPFWISLSRAATGGASTSPAPLQRLFALIGKPGYSFEDLVRNMAGTSVKDAWKRYDVERWNQAPVASPGSPVRSAFKKWYGITTHPEPKEPLKVLLGNLPESRQDYGPSAPMKPATTRYRWLSFPDKRAREIEIDRKGSGPSAGSRFTVQAFIKLASGKWRVEDWTTRESVRLCRDKPEENAQEIVLAFADATTEGPDVGPVRETVKLRQSCAPPSYRILHVGVKQTTTGSWPVNTCAGAYGGTQTRLVNAGAQPVKASDALTGGAVTGYVGGVEADVVSTTGASLHGCDYSQELVPPCVSQPTEPENVAIRFDVNIAPGSDTATVTWNVLDALLGFSDGGGTFLTGCTFFNFGFTAPAGEGVVHMPVDDFFGNEPFIVDVDDSYDATVQTSPPQQLHSTYNYQLTLQRVS